ncbi:MAG: elongation factor P [Simkaniaceae bacterium]|nr:elongation factor P [Simkaniaceae bacterium]
MPQVSTNDLKSGLKVEIDNEPYNIVTLEFVKPGKGQAFTRVKLKHLTTGRVLEKTYKSGEKLDIADIEESKMRMLYKDQDGVTFMHDQTFDQMTIPHEKLGDAAPWLKEETVYDLLFYNGEVLTVAPPTFLELKIVSTEPGARGDTASGRVLKAAVVETGAKVQIPIFVEEGEIIKVDTRTSEYVSRV